MRNGSSECKDGILIDVLKSFGGFAYILTSVIIARVLYQVGHMLYSGNNGIYILSPEI